MEKCKYSGGIVMESEGSLGRCGMPPQLTVSGMQLQLSSEAHWYWQLRLHNCAV